MKKSAFQIGSILLMGIVCFLGIFVTQNRVEAYTFARNIETTLDVVSPTEVQVTQVHRLTWDNPTFFFPASKNYLYAYIYPAFVEQTAELNSKVRDVTVKGGNGVTLSFTKSIVDGAVQLKVPYYDNLDNGSPLTFTISYKTNLFVLQEGGLLEITYPGLSKDFKQRVSHSSDGYDEVTGYSVAVLLPERFGSISSVTPTPTTKGTVKNKTILQYDVSKILGNAIHITVGDTRKIRFTLSGKTYATNSDTPDFAKGLLTNYIEVVLPSSREGAENSGQEVYYSKIVPFPVEIKTDEDGNIIAKIPVSATQEGSITIEGYALLHNKSLPESVKLAKKSQIPSTMQVYLNGEPKFWQTTDQNIVSIAKKESIEGDLMYDQVRKTLGYVSQTLTYARIDNEAALTRLGAVEALRQKVGVCMEYSDLLLTLLRAQGIPTRTVFGDGVGSRVDRTLKGIGHQWVSVWFPESGWIPVDPTWSDNGQEYIGQDFNHFTWYVASKSVNEPSGFNCLSWDSRSPCHEALQIDTAPVDQLPSTDTLMTLNTIREKVTASKNSENKIVGTLQGIVSFLGGSQLGRIVLSRQGLLIIFAFILYSLLVGIVSSVSKRIRRLKGQKMQPKSPTGNQPTA